jgi:RNA polymerase sigma-70 factor (ECF subfamily)
MSQDAEDRARGWERFRDFLSLMARVQADPHWRGKIDLSGVVQQTLLEAFQSATATDGWTDAQKAAWLRQALAHNLADEVRKLRTGKRDARRERSLEAEMAESVSRLEGLLPAALTTPSKHAEREERRLQLTRALSALPEAQRQAIELHHLRGQTLSEVAGALGTTKPAVAGLLHRGLRRLRELLAGDESRAGS